MRSIALITFCVLASMSGPSFGVPTTAAVLIAQNSLPENPGLPVRQLEILRGVLTSGSALTGSLHQEFWKGLSYLSDEQKATSLARLQTFTPIVLRYQQALWAAARRSLEVGMAVYTDELKAAAAELDRIEPAASRTSHASAKNFLEAAASHRRFSKQGQSLTITADLINETISGLANAITRFSNLMNPEWTGGQ